jgi:hypothetical protein
LEIKDGKLIPKLKNLFQGVLICNERQEWLPLVGSMRTDWYIDILEMGKSFDMLKKLIFKSRDDLKFLTT